MLYNHALQVISLSLSMWLLCGWPWDMPQCFPHISLKSWRQKGHNCEAGRSNSWLTVCVCNAVCRSARLWCFLGVSETDCLAYRELTQFLQGKGSISHLVLPPTPIQVSKGKRERVWVSWMACYCKSILNWHFWHMELMPLKLIGCFLDVLCVCCTLKKHECLLLCCNV